MQVSRCVTKIKYVLGKPSPFHRVKGHNFSKISSRLVYCTREPVNVLGFKNQFLIPLQKDESPFLWIWQWLLWSSLPFSSTTIRTVAMSVIFHLYLHVSINVSSKQYPKFFYCISKKNYKNLLLIPFGNCYRFLSHLHL